MVNHVICSFCNSCISKRRQPISFILDSLSAQINVPDTKFSRNTMKLLNHNPSTLTKFVARSNQDKGSTPSLAHSQVAIPHGPGLLDDSYHAYIMLERYIHLRVWW